MYTVSTMYATTAHGGSPRMAGKISAAQRDLATRHHALYRFYDRSDVLLYVGITVDLPTRMGNHQTDKPWWADVARMTVEHHASRADVLDAERQAIRDEKPLYNVHHNELVEVEEDESADHLRVLYTTAFELLEDDDERQAILHDARFDFEGNELGPEAHRLSATEDAISILGWGRTRAIELFDDLLDVLGLLPGAPPGGWYAAARAAFIEHHEPGTYLPPFDIRAYAINDVVAALSTRYLDVDLPSGEGDSWREVAISTGRRSQLAVDRSAARIAAEYKRTGVLPAGCCYGPGLSGARCPRPDMETTFFEVCPLGCGPGPCTGHDRWCRKHASNVKYGRISILSDDPIASYPIAKSVVRPPADDPWADPWASTDRQEP
jgi:hypothetical protein